MRVSTEAIFCNSICPRKRQNGYTSHSICTRKRQNEYTSQAICTQKRQNGYTLHSICTQKRQNGYTSHFCKNLLLKHSLRSFTYICRCVAHDSGVCATGSYNNSFSAYSPVVHSKLTAYGSYQEKIEAKQFVPSPVRCSSLRMNRCASIEDPTKKYCSINILKA